MRKTILSNILYTNQKSDTRVLRPKKKVLFAFGWWELTSPLAPLQPDTLAGNHSYFWLERGVHKRGGFAPSQNHSPSQTYEKTRTQEKPV
jgi:hypothetical protein